MKNDIPYSPTFFRYHYAASINSAEVVVPLLLELLSPQSVIDVGCGTGIWLSVFKAHSIGDITGVDGDWVEDELLQIPRSCFLTHDLTQKLNIERRFDLALSLETAEHLDQEYAKNFVSTLVKLSSVVVFSAAIPFQGGANHVNEQWPDYWVRIFAEHEYVPIDCIREKIWNNQDVAWWYAQNILVFADKAHLSKNPKLQSAFEGTRVAQLSLVHPGMHLKVNQRLESALWGPGLRHVLGMLPRTVIKAIQNRMNRKWVAK